MKKIKSLLCLVSTLLLMSGCQTTSNNYQNSSVVDYLYPGTSAYQAQETIPRLVLPLKVGIAFTPDHYQGERHLAEAKKLALLDKVKNEFLKLAFVDTIEVIPSAYLKPQGSFQNLDQIRHMFNIDIIALVSYDQTRFTDEGLASLAYWTLIGAYIVPAEKNATHTMLDAVLYDINSRNLLFRAPGISTVKSHSTPVNLSEQTREDALMGFDLASDDLIENLTVQLERFKTTVSQSPEKYQVVKSEGYRGGGSTSLWLFLTVLALGRLLIRRK